jgi:hypothetical protein
MSTPVLCTNNTRWIGNESYLYLHYGSWDKRGYYGTVLDLTKREVLRYRGLHQTHQGVLYSNGKSIWRITNAGLAPYLNHTTKLWCNAVGEVLVAEPVTYELLRLEAIFSVGVN